MTNAKNLISQSEPPAPKVIMVDKKMRTGVYILSGGAGASATPEKLITINKRNMRSPAMSPPRKYPIPNQDINILITEKSNYSATFRKNPPGFKSLINEAHDPNSTEY